MSGLSGIFGHPDLPANSKGGSPLDGQSPLTMAPQFGSVAPLTLPSVSRQYSGSVPTPTSITAFALIDIYHTTLVVPAGKTAKLDRVSWALNAGLSPRITYSGSADIWTGSAGASEAAPGTVLLDNSTGTSDVSGYFTLQIENQTAGTLSTSSGDGIWANIRIE